MPDSPEILDTKAEFMIAVGDALAAVEASESAVAKAPSSARLRITYARSLSEAGRVSEAKRQLVLVIHLATRLGVSGAKDLAEAEAMLREN